MKNQFKYWSTADKTAWYVDCYYPDREVGEDTYLLGPFNSLEEAEKSQVLNDVAD